MTLPLWLLLAVIIACIVTLHRWHAATRGQQSLIFLVGMLALAAYLMLAQRVAAAEFHVCVDGRGRYTWTDAECAVVPLAALPCDLVIGVPSCDPPAGVVSFPRLPVPFDGPVRFGGIVTAQARTYWTWTKAGDPSRACTASERAEQGAYGRACAVRLGETLFMTPPVYVPPAP